jgi:hypothetical protein
MAMAGNNGALNTEHTDGRTLDLLPACLMCAGTHVGGVIGARNQGQGVFGVVPGIAMVGIKVMDSSGSGPLDNVYRGYAEVLTR